MDFFAAEKQFIPRSVWMAKFITIKNLSGWRKNRPIFNQLVFDRKLIKLIEIIYSFELLGVKSPFSSVALLVYCPFNYTLTAVELVIGAGALTDVCQLNFTQPQQINTYLQS